MCERDQRNIPERDFEERVMVVTEGMGERAEEGVENRSATPPLLDHQKDSGNTTFFYIERLG